MNELELIETYPSPEPTLVELVLTNPTIVIILVLWFIIVSAILAFIFARDLWQREKKEE